MFSEHKFHNFRRREKSLCSTAIKKYLHVNGLEQLNFQRWQNQYDQERNTLFQMKFRMWGWGWESGSQTQFINSVQYFYIGSPQEI